LDFRKPASERRRQESRHYAQSEDFDAARRIIDRLRERGFLDHKGLGEANPGLYEVAFTLER
jgi:hypothetical protein